MMKITMLPKFIIATVFLCMPLTGQAQADYEEIGGKVVIEAESLDLTGSSWVKESSIAGATGDEKAYIRYAGASFNTNPDKGKIEATIKINTTGKYLFKWRTLQGGSGHDDANDSWLKFSGENVDFYAEKEDSKAYPKGYEGKKINETAIIPNDKGPGEKGAFKIWSCCQTNVWLWWAKTWDENSHFIFVEFDKPGIYTMEISGRSIGNIIDRITLSNDPKDVNEPTSSSGDTETPENDFRLAVSTFDLSKSGIAIYPNPAQGFLNIKGLKNTTAKIDLIDALGRVLPADMQQQNTNTIRINTTTLEPGLYFVRIGQLGQSAFVVK